MFDLLIGLDGEKVGITLKSGMQCIGILEMLEDFILCIHSVSPKDEVYSNDHFTEVGEVAMVSTYEGMAVRSNA